MGRATSPFFSKLKGSFEFAELVATFRKAACSVPSVQTGGSATTSCMTVHSFLAISMPESPHPQQGDNSRTSSGEWGVMAGLSSGFFWGLNDLNK